LAGEYPYNEQELLQLVATGDTQAYKEIYNRYYPGVFRFALQFVDNRQAAEDSTTETFLKLWQMREQVTAIRSLSSFLFTAIRNTCLTYLRNDRRHAIHHDRIAALSAAPEQELRQHEITESLFLYLEAEVNKLSPQQREVLRLHLQGMKHEEISRTLGVTEKTVRNLKSEAVKKLRLAFVEKELFGLFFLYLHLFR
jgi:RNA polymerase sigma-70 factor (ECF subfamily)